MVKIVVVFNHHIIVDVLVILRPRGLVYYRLLYAYTQLCAQTSKVVCPGCLFIMETGSLADLSLLTNWSGLASQQVQRPTCAFSEWADKHGPLSVGSENGTRALRLLRH